MPDYFFVSTLYFMSRPAFDDLQTGAEFNRWYWLKTELVALCKAAGLPTTGRKFELRDRLMYALDHDGKLAPSAPKPRPVSTFNWSKAPLTPDTVLTDNVSFGPNFRRFMKEEIGARFSCHGDFMDWVRAHPGKTLREAVAAWHRLEERKRDPDFQRRIAASNMYNQYTRDFLADQPGKTPADARRYWLLKKVLPTADGVVRYAPEDLELSA